MKIKNFYILTFFVFGILIFSACQKAGINSTGSEYMPEMYHSVAFEANYETFYPRNQWVDENTYMKYAMPRKPVKGTIARDNGVSDYETFDYGTSPEERARAMKNIVDAPFPITEQDIAKGKELYTYYCAICHGDKGDSKGWLVRENGGKYPAMPANFTSPDLKNSSDGRYYYTIMRGGQNIMEPYYDKLDLKERWQVIKYIRTLQK